MKNLKSKTGLDLSAKIKTNMNSFEKFNFYSETVDWESINTEIKNTKWQDVIQTKSLKEYLDFFYERCVEISTKYVPERNVSKKKVK